MSEKLTQFERTGNPFPGLRPFETEEYNLFFGREGQADELLARLGRTRFLAVVGTSGSGKSSLIRAGLLPALYGGLMAGAGSAWRIAVMRPGHDPLGNLARALAADSVLGSPDVEEAVGASIIETTLRRSTLGLVDAARQARLPAGENVLVVVDQFEELFRFRAMRDQQGTDDEAAAFVKLLLEAARQRDVPVYVVLTMRSDFLGDCAQFQGLPEAINDGQYLIPRMTRDERRMAITGPAVVGDAEISPPLVNRLLNDVGDNPDQLPILQHALMRTWDHWSAHRGDGEPVGLEDYLAVGTMSDALSKHADEAFDELKDDRGRHVAEVLFKALTERGADNREVRRPTRLREVCEITGATPEEVARVVEVFRREGRSFLMPAEGTALEPDTVIDISHESLIRNWARLREWVKEEAEAARIYRRLAEAAAAHRAGEGGLLDDVTLGWVDRWRDRYKPNRAWGLRYHPGYDEAMAYLEESRAASEARIAAEGERERRELEQARAFAEQQRRSARRLRWLLAGMAVMFLLALAGAGYAYTMGKAARDSEQRALESERRARDSERVAIDAKNNAEEANRKLQDTIASEKQAKLDAEESAKKALDEKRRAEEEETRANEQAEIAAESARRADASRRAEETARLEAEQKQKQFQAALVRSNLLRRGLEEAGRDNYDESLVAFDCLRKNIEAQLPNMPPPPTNLTPRVEIRGCPPETSSTDTSKQLAVQLGWVYSNIGGVNLKRYSYTPALASYRQAQTILERHPPEEDAILLDTLYGLARAYHAVGRSGYGKDPDAASGENLSRDELLARSENLYRRLLELRKKRADPETPAGAEALAEIYTQLAALHADMYRPADAEGDLQLAVVHRRKVFELRPGDGFAPLAAAMDALAQFYYGQSSFKEAANAYVALIDLYEEKGYSDWSPESTRALAESYGDLAQVFKASGEKERADAASALAGKFHELAVKTNSESRDADSPEADVYNDFDELGDLYVKLGRYERAGEAYGYSLLMRTESNPDNAPLASYERLGRLFREHFKDAPEAAKYYQELVEATKDTKGSGYHPGSPLHFRVEGLRQLGALKAGELNQPDEAESLFESALTTLDALELRQVWEDREAVSAALADLYRRRPNKAAELERLYTHRLQFMDRGRERFTFFYRAPQEYSPFMSAYVRAVAEVAAFYLEKKDVTRARAAYQALAAYVKPGFLVNADAAQLKAVTSALERLKALILERDTKAEAAKLDRLLVAARARLAEIEKQTPQQQQ